MRASPLKVYVYLDARGTQHMVAARNQEAACRAFRCRVCDLRRYGNCVSDKTLFAITAAAPPGTVWIRTASITPHPWRLAAGKEI